MCGIAGYFVTDKTRVGKASLQRIAQNLLMEIENRGHDAAGIGFIGYDKKYVYIAKAPVSASRFLRIPGHELTLGQLKHMPQAMLIHTRFATQGVPANNENNHPLYSKKSGLCMVHNGWISNDDNLIKNFDLGYDAEVDSEIYLRLIEQFHLEKQCSIEDSIVQATTQVRGNVACGMIQAGVPDVMWVWHDEGALAIVRTDWGWVFASTVSAAVNAVTCGSTSFDGSVIALLDMPKSVIFTFSVTQELKITHGAITQAYRNTLMDDSVFSEFDWKAHYEKYPLSHGSGVSYYPINGNRQLSLLADQPKTAPVSITQAVTNSQIEQELDSHPWQPKTKVSQRSLWVEKNKGQKPLDCYCLDNYVCVMCQRTESWYGKKEFQLIDLEEVSDETIQ